MAGIFRDVYLYSTAEVYIQDVFVNPTLEDDYIKGIFRDLDRRRERQGAHSRPPR